MTAQPTASTGAPLRFDWSPQERAQVLQAANRLQARAVQGGPAWVTLLWWLGIVGTMWLASQLTRSVASGGLQTVLNITAGIVPLALWVALMGRRARAIATTRLGDFLGVQFDDKGLYVESSDGATRYDWCAVHHAEHHGPFVFIHLRGLMLVAIPLRVFAAAGVHADQFIIDINARAHAAAHASMPIVEAGTVVTATGIAPPGSRTPETESVVAAAPSYATPGFTTGSSYWRALFTNVVAGFGMAVFAQRAVRQLHASGAQVVGLLTVAVLLGLMFDFARVGVNGQFQLWGLRGMLLSLAITLTVGATVAITLDASRALARIAVAIAALLVAFQLPGAALETLHAWASRTDKASMQGLFYLEWAVWLWFVVAQAVASIRAAIAAGAQPAPHLRNAAGVAVVLLVATMQWLFRSDASLWTPRADAAAADSHSARQMMAAATEAVLYKQPQLLQATLDAVQPGRRGVTELYYIGFAGAGYQDVFLNEVTGAEKVLHDRFHAQGRGALLVNARRTPLERPFANATSLQQALTTIAAKMNRDEDVLLLFMTSHGSSKHELEVEMWPYRFDAITPQKLRALLDSSGIRHRVVVISACYSGGFVAPLMSPDTLIVTAAHAERTSFGCGDGQVWTYFGEAYFAHGLASTGSFERAFEAATPRVTERELREQREPSQPQIWVGERIREKLSTLEATIRR